MFPDRRLRRLCLAAAHPTTLRQIPGNLRSLLPGRARREASGEAAAALSLVEPRQPQPVDFAPYRPGATAVPIRQVTPPDGLYIHTYSDVPPWSPSGRFLAVTRIPFEHRHPRLGETADVCIVDLAERQIPAVYRTRGWCMHLGAHLHWGADDWTLMTVDVVVGQARGVVLDLERRQARVLGGPLSDRPRDGRFAVGTDLGRINPSQEGYGTPLRAWPALGEEGRGLPVWRTDIPDGTP